MMSDWCIDPSFFFLFSFWVMTQSLEQHTHCLLEVTHVAELAPRLWFEVARHVSMARIERYVSGRPVYRRWRFLFQTSVRLILAKYGWLKEERRKGRKPRKKDGRVFKVSIFSLFWIISETFPFTESFGSCFSLSSMQMVSTDLCKDAAWITVNFVSSCTVGQLLGNEIM